MYNIQGAAFDMRTKALEPPHGGNDWKWFSDRKIKVFVINGSIPPAEAPVEQTFNDHVSLRKHCVAVGIEVDQLVYISDDIHRLRWAKHDGGFLTLAIPPAHAKTWVDTVSMTPSPTVTQLTGLLNYLNWRRSLK